MSFRPLCTDCLMWPDPIPYGGTGSGIWPLSSFLIPDLFPLSKMGSGHARLVYTFITQTTPTHWLTFNSQGSWPVNAHSDWKLPTVPEMESLQSERSVSEVTLCKKRNDPPSDILQPSTTAVMCCHLEGDTTISPCPTFMLGEPQCSCKQKWVS